MSVWKVSVPILLILAFAAGAIRAVVDDPSSATEGLATVLGGGKPASSEGEDAAEGSIDLSDYTYSTDEAIKLFELRVKVAPGDHTSHATLGDLYERKARETDDLACFARAEDALRKALELLPDYTRAKVSLAVVQADRHKFAEALEVAQAVYKANPKNIDALATVGDTEIELGRYAEAEVSLRELARRLPNSAPVLVRQARLEELKGHPEDALRLVRRAVETMQPAASPSDLAWYRYREADILFNAGRVEESGRVAEAILKDVPAHHDATASLARVRAAQGRTREAIELYEKAVAIAPDPSMLVALGDLYSLVGDESRALANYDRMEKATAGQPEYRRGLSLFYADHDRSLPAALELAREDLEQRQDIYGHDTLAWALLKNGRPEEADKAIAEALKLGTRDARLYFHAGMIAHRVGDASKTRDYLGRALALNPSFSPRDAEQARRVLAE